MDELGRGVTILIPRSVQLAIAGAIVGGEFALNSEAFEVFQKLTILTWAMALAVAVGIPVVAHSTGI